MEPPSRLSAGDPSFSTAAAPAAEAAELGAVPAAVGAPAAASTEGAAAKIAGLKERIKQATDAGDYDRLPPLIQQIKALETAAGAAAPAPQQVTSDREFRVVPFVVPGPAMELLKRKCAQEGTAYHTLTFLFYLLALSRTLGRELSGVVRVWIPALPIASCPSPLAWLPSSHLYAPCPTKQQLTASA